MMQPSYYLIPSALMKRRKIKEAKPYDEALLLKNFGTPALVNVIINESYVRKESSRMHGFTFQFLRKNFILPLNHTEPLGCFLTQNDALAIFTPPLEDLKILKNLLPFLMEKFNVNASVHRKIDFDDDKPLFIRGDCLSTFWNKDGQKILNLPVMSFQGKVALKIMGLMYYEADDGSPCVKLQVHLEQVKVMEEGNGEVDLIKDCMFN